MQESFVSSLTPLKFPTARSSVPIPPLPPPIYISLSLYRGSCVLSGSLSSLVGVYTADSDRAGWRIVERLRRVERRASAAPSPSRLDDDDGDGEVAHGRAPSAIPIPARPSGGDEILLAFSLLRRLFLDSVALSPLRRCQSSPAPDLLARFLQSSPARKERLG